MVIDMDNGIPDFLKIPQAQRNATWAKNPPRPIVQQMSPPVDAPMRAAQETKKKIKTTHRIARLKTNQEWKAIPSVFRRWDPRRSRFVDEREDDARRLKLAAERLGITLENDEMTKNAIVPYLAGQDVPAERGKTSIKTDAPDWEVQAKLRAAALRVGRKLQRLEVVSPDGNVLATWTIDDERKGLHNGPVSIDLTTPDVSADGEPQEENTDMTSKKKKTPKKKDAAAKKNGGTEKGYKGHRLDSRKEKAHRWFDEIGPEAARPKILALGIKPGTVSSWFGAFKK